MSLAKETKKKREPNISSAFTATAALIILEYCRRPKKIDTARWWRRRRWRRIKYRFRARIAFFIRVAAPVRVPSEHFYIVENCFLGDLCTKNDSYLCSMTSQTCHAFLECNIECLHLYRLENGNSAPLFPRIVLRACSVVENQFFKNGRRNRRRKNEKNARAHTHRPRGPRPA